MPTSRTQSFVGDLDVHPDDLTTRRPSSSVQSRTIGRTARSSPRCPAQQTSPRRPGWQHVRPNTTGRAHLARRYGGQWLRRRTRRDGTGRLAGGAGRHSRAQPDARSHVSCPRTADAQLWALRSATSAGSQGVAGPCQATPAFTRASDSLATHSQGRSAADRCAIHSGMAARYCQHDHVSIHGLTARSVSCDA